jgi:glycosyltransferase involved in cell wall biosynthesis
MSIQKKIAFVSNTDGAQYKFRGNLMRQCVEHGFLVTSIASNNSPEGTYNANISTITSDTYRFPFLRTGVFGYLVTIWKIFEVLGRNNFDIVHAFGHEAAIPVILYKILGRKKTKVFVTFTGMGRLFPFHNTSKFSIAARALLFFYRRTSALIDAYICLNNLDLELIKARVSNVGKEFVIPGEGLKIANQPGSTRGEDEIIRCVFAGRLMREKGIIELLSAIVRLKRSDIEFLIAGTIDNKLKKQDLVRGLIEGKLKNAKYLSHLESAAELISSSDLVILPTRYREGMPMVLVEAIAFDKYIIASPAPGVKDLFEAGCVGTLLSDASEEAILASLESLESAKIRRVLGRNRSLFLDIYEAEAVNSKIVKLYHSEMSSR